MRFGSIEGLRAWLAWTVVAGHLIIFTGLNLHGGALAAMGRLPTLAVSIFICISGFVIANLLISRDEAYGPYLIRRAFRIFPGYLLMAALGAATIVLAVKALPHIGWAATPGYAFADETRGAFASQTHHLLRHILAHATLMQGAVPDSLLPYSERVFSPPSWSLSLEWQFYLVAPLGVALLRRRQTAPFVVAVVILALIAYHTVLQPYYRLPSMLFGKGMCFLIGIGARINLRRLEALVRPAGAATTTIAALAGVCVIAPQTASYVLWLMFLCYMLSNEGAPGANPLDRWMKRLGDLAFNSPVAQALGARAFAVYIVHWPMLELSSFLWLTRLHLGQVQALMLVGGTTVALTLVVAEVLHRTVEKPMMRLGAQRAARLASARRGEAMAAA